MTTPMMSSENEWATPGTKVRVVKPGLPDDGHTGVIKSRGAEGVWLHHGPYVSSTWYDWDQIQPFEDVVSERTKRIRNQQRTLTFSELVCPLCRGTMGDGSHDNLGDGGQVVCQTATAEDVGRHALETLQRTTHPEVKR